MAYNFMNWNISYSAVSLVSLESILVDQIDTNPMTFNLQNITIEDLNLDGKESMIEVSNFIYPNFSIYLL